MPKGEKIYTDGVMLELEELFHLYSRELFWVALAFCGDRQLAEDAVQEAFLRICEEPQKLRDVQNVRTYLVKITKNYLIDHFRKQQLAHKHEPLVVEEISALEALEYSTEEYQELLIKANELLNSLPEGARKIFVLAAVEGLSYKEIAEREAVSVNTVKTQLRIARKKLKEYPTVVILILTEVLK